MSDGDLLVSDVQPRSALVKVLFEPQTKLADSVTYDITAWALPYVYGVTAYALRNIIPVSPADAQNVFRNNLDEDAYGYVIRWQGISSAKTVLQLLKKGIRVRYTEVSFEAGGQSFDRGSVIITRNGNVSFGKDL